MNRRHRPLRAASALLAAVFLLSDVASYAAIEPLPSSGMPSDGSIGLDPSRFEAPSEFVSLKEIHRGGSGVFIIHVQDAHANLSGQQNMAAALDRIMERYDVSLVLVEGGTRDDTLTPIKSVAPPEVWKRVAKSFLIEGKISGDEYLNLISDHPMKIVGIEDPQLYQRSVREYAALASLREETLGYLRRIRLSVDKLKQRAYPDRLLAYEKRRASVASDGAAYKELLELMSAAGVPPEGYPNLERLRRLDREEERIDFGAASLEQAALAAEIVRRGAERELAESLSRGALSRERTASQYTHFENTFHIARQKGIRLEDYPALRAYVAYLGEFCAIDLDAAVRETAQAEDEAYRKLLSGEDPKLLRAVDRYLELLTTAYNIQMSTHDFRMFQSNEPDMATARYLAFLNRKLAEAGYLEDLVPYRDTLERGKQALLSFYDSVSQRDFAFVRNAERILKQEGQKTAVLISGGYHTPHLKKLFREKGHSYAVLTPIVTAPTNQAKYEKLLLEPLRAAQKAAARSARKAGAPEEEAASDLEKDLLALSKRSDGVSIQKTGEPQSGARLAELVEAAARLASDSEEEAQEKTARATLSFYSRDRQQAPSASAAPVTAARLADVTDLLGDTTPPATWTIPTFEGAVTPQRFEEADTSLPGDAPEVLAAGASLRDLRFLAERYPTARITAVDIDREVLAKLAASVAKDAALAARVRFFRADAAALTDYTDEQGAPVFPEASFDLFYAVGINASAFRSDADAEPVLRAMAQQEVRLVKPGGLIYHPQTADHYFAAIDAGLLSSLDPARPYFYRRSGRTGGARLSEWFKHPLLSTAAWLQGWVGGSALLGYLPALRRYLASAAPRLAAIRQAGDALRFHAIAYDNIASHGPAREEAVLGEEPVSVARSREQVYRRPRIGEDGTILVAEQHAVIVPAEQLAGRTLLTSHVKNCSAMVAELLGADGRTYYMMAHQYPQTFGRVAAPALEDLFRSGFVRKATVRAFAYRDGDSVRQALEALTATVRGLDASYEIESSVDDHRYGAALTLTSTPDGSYSHLWSSSRIFPMDYEKVDFSRTRPSLVYESPKRPVEGARLAVASIKSVRELTRKALEATSSTGLHELELEGPVLPPKRVSEMVDAVRQGQLLVVGLGRLTLAERPKEQVYQDANLALIDLAHDLDVAFGEEKQVLGFAIGEALRNAVLHGNALDLRLPVLVKVDVVSGRAAAVRIYDTAASTDSRVLSGVPETTRVAGEALGGTGAGIDAVQDAFSYERNYVTDDRLGTIGTEVILKPVEKGARLAQAVKYSQLATVPMSPLSATLSASEARTVVPGIEVRRLAVERPGVRAVGEATVIDLQLYDAVQRHDARVYDKDNTGSLPNADPEAGYTVQDWVENEEDPSSVVAAFNKSQGHGWEPNTLTIQDGRLIMKRPGARGMLQPVYTPPSGEYWVLSLDPGVPGVFQMRLDERGRPEAALPVRNGFGGPVLLKGGRRMLDRVRFMQRPSVAGVDLGWPRQQPAALTAYGYDAQGRLVVVQLAGNPNDPEHTESTLDDLVDALERLGVRDAILGGGSGDVQRYFRDEPVQVVRAEGRNGSRFQLVSEKLELGQNPGEGQRRVGEVLLIVPKARATAEQGARLALWGAFVSAVDRTWQRYRLDWDLGRYRSTRDQAAFLSKHAASQGEALKALIARAADEDPFVREAVLYALAGSTDPEVLRAVYARVDDAEWSVRHAAILALRGIGEGPLREEVAENYKRVLRAAADARARPDALRELVSLTGPVEALRAGLPLAAAEEGLFERRLIELLTQLTPSDATSIELYLEALDSAHPGLRAAASAALDSLGTSRRPGPAGFPGALSVFERRRLSDLSEPERQAWLTTYLTQPLRTYLSSPKEEAEGEIVLWDSTKLESMVPLKDRIRVIETAGRRGDAAVSAEALRQLLAELSVFLTKRVYDRHSIEISVEITAYFDDFGRARQALHGLERDLARRRTATLPRLRLAGLDRPMAERALATKRVPLDALPAGVRRFLEFLRTNGLEDIALIGGTGWNVFFGMEPNDYDVSIIRDLSESERSRYLWTTSAAQPELVRDAREKLGRLAAALGRKLEDFELPGGDPAHPAFSDEKEIQYAGPIDTEGDAPGGKVLIKRVLVDRGSGQVFSSNTGASWLRIALGVDPQDPTQAKLYFLDQDDAQLNPISDLLNGWIRIVGDDNNFTMGDILRAIRLQYLQGGLIVSPQGLPLGEEEIAQILKPEIAIYEAAGTMPVPLAHMTYKILRDAPADRRDAIRASLDRLGFLDLAARTLTLQPDRIGYPRADQRDSGARLAAIPAQGAVDPFSQAAELAVQRVARLSELKRELDRQFQALGFTSTVPAGPLDRVAEWSGWLSSDLSAVDQARILAAEEEWTRWWAAARAEMRTGFARAVAAKLEKIEGRVLAGRSNRRAKRTNLSRYPEYYRAENARDAALKAAESIERIDAKLIENFRLLRAYRYADPDDPSSALRRRWEPGFPDLRAELETDAALTYDKAMAALEKAVSGELRVLMRSEGLWDALSPAARRELEARAVSLAQPAFFGELYIPSVFEKRFEEQKKLLLRLARAPEDHIPHQPQIRDALKVFVNDLLETAARGPLNAAAAELYRKQLALLTDPDYTFVLFLGDMAADGRALQVLSDAYAAARDPRVRAQVIAAYLRVLWRLFRSDGADRDGVMRRWSEFSDVVAGHRFAAENDPAGRAKQYAISVWTSEAADYLAAHWGSYERGDRITFTVDGVKKTEDMNFMQATRWSRQRDEGYSEAEREVHRLLRQAGNRAILRELFNDFQEPSTRGEIYRRPTEGPREGIAVPIIGARLAQRRRGPDLEPSDRQERERALNGLIRRINDAPMEVVWEQDKSGTPGGIGEVRARLRAEEKILEVPEGLALRVFIEPAGEWTGRFERHLAYLTKPKKTPRLDMPPKLLPPPGSLGQIVLMVQRVSEPGERPVLGMQIYEVQQRVGYRNLPQRLRWRLDLWRDRAIERLSTEILEGLGLAVYANNDPRSIFFRDKDEIRRSYIEPFQRLGWLFDHPIVIDGARRTVTFDPRSAAVLSGTKGARLPLLSWFLSLFDRRSVSQRRLDEARAFVAEYLRERPESGLSGILIFGSVAKGTARKDSDLDYLMIKKAGTERALTEEDLEFHRFFSGRFSYIEHAPTMPALMLTADLSAPASRVDPTGIQELFLPPQLLNPFAFDVRTPGAAFVTDWRVAAADPDSQALIETKIRTGIQEAYLRRGPQARRDFGARLAARIWDRIVRIGLWIGRGLGLIAPDRFEALSVSAAQLAATAYAIESSMPELPQTMMRTRLRALGDKLRSTVPHLNERDQTEAGLGLYESWRSLVEVEAISRSLLTYSKDPDLTRFAEALLEVRVPQYETFFEQWGRLARPDEAYKLHARIAGEYLADSVGFLAPDAVALAVAERRDRLTRILGRVHQAPSSSLSLEEVDTRLEGWIFAVGDAALGLRFEPALRADIRSALTNETGGLLYKARDRLEFLQSVVRRAMGVDGARLADGRADPDSERIAQSWAGIWESRRQRGPFEGTFDNYPPMIIDFVEQRLRSALPPAGEGRIVDLGAGADLWVARKMKAAFPGARVQAVDLFDVDPSRVQGAEGIEYRKAFAEDTGFESGAFDAVLSTFGIDYADRDRAFAELYRILKPGGRAVLVMHDPLSMFVGDIDARQRSTQRVIDFYRSMRALAEKGQLDDVNWQMRGLIKRFYEPSKLDAALADLDRRIASYEADLVNYRRVRSNLFNDRESLRAYLEGRGLIVREISTIGDVLSDSAPPMAYGVVVERPLSAQEERGQREGEHLEGGARLAVGPREHRIFEEARWLARLLRQQPEGEYTKVMQRAADWIEQRLRSAKNLDPIRFAEEVQDFSDRTLLPEGYLMELSPDYFHEADDYLQFFRIDRQETRRAPSGEEVRVLYVRNLTPRPGQTEPPTLMGWNSTRNDYTVVLPENARQFVDRRLTPLIERTAPPAPADLSLVRTVEGERTAAKLRVHKEKLLRQAFPAYDRKSVLDMVLERAIRHEIEHEVRRRRIVASGSKMPYDESIEEQVAYLFNLQDPDLNVRYSLFTVVSNALRWNREHFWFILGELVGMPDLDSKTLFTRIEKETIADRLTSTVALDDQALIATSKQAYERASKRWAAYYGVEGARLAVEATDEEVRLSYEQLSPEERSTLLAALSENVYAEFYDGPLAERLSELGLTEYGTVPVRVLNVLYPEFDERGTPAVSVGARLAERRAVLQGLLSDPAQRPDPLRVLELVRAGMGEEEVLQASQALGRQRPAMDKTLAEYDALVPYLYKAAGELASTWKGRTVLSAGRDAEPMHDLLSYLGAVGADVPATRLFPGSISFWSRFKTLDERTRRDFFASFGITEEAIRSGAQWVIVDSGFYGSIGKSVHEELIRLYPGLPGGIESLKERTLPIRVLAPAPSNGYAEPLLELETDPATLERVAGLFPKTWPKSETLIRLLGLDARQAFRHAIGVAIQLLPHHHGSYADLATRAGVPVAVPGESRIQHDVDFVFSLNPAAVNPAAALRLQSRLAARVLEDQRAGRLDGLLRARPAVEGGARLAEPTTPEFLAGLLGERKDLIAAEIGAGGSPFLHTVVSDARASGKLDFSEIFVLNPTSVEKFGEAIGEDGRYPMTKLPIAPPRTYDPDLPLPAVALSRDASLRGRIDVLFANAPVLKSSSGRMFVEEIDSMTRPGATVLVRLHYDDIYVPRLMHFLGDLEQRGFRLESFLTELPQGYPSTDYTEATSVPLIVLRREGRDETRERAVIESLFEALREPNHYVQLAAAAALGSYGPQRASAAADLIDQLAAGYPGPHEDYVVPHVRGIATYLRGPARTQGAQEEGARLATEQELLDRFSAKVSGGDADMRAWVTENIRDLKAKTASGAHRTLFYPAAGADALRTLLAYDADRVIAADDIDPETTAVLSEFGITPTVTETIQGALKVRSVAFELDGRKREVLEVIGDVRDLDLKALIGTDRTDIFHVYFPTGAGDLTAREVRDGELRAKYGEGWWKFRETEAPADPDRVVKPGFHSGLDAANLSRVVVGGFLALDEHPLLPGSAAPKELMDLLGLEEVTIVARHPYQVRTSFFPEKGELERFRKGAIYRKTAELEPARRDAALALFRKVSEALMIVRWMESGQFVYFQYLDDSLAEVKAAGDAALAAGLDAPAVGAAVGAAGRMLTERLDALRRTTEEFVDLYEAGQVDGLGLTRAPFGGGLRSERFPLVQNLLAGDGAPVEEHLPGLRSFLQAASEDKGARLADAAAPTIRFDSPLFPEVDTTVQGEGSVLLAAEEIYPSDWKKDLLGPQVRELGLPREYHHAAWELLYNALKYSRDSLLDRPTARIEARRFERADGRAPLLSLRIEQSRLDEKDWQRLAGTRDAFEKTGLELLQDASGRAYRGEAEGGLGFANVAKLMRQMPVRLEYERQADGRVVTRLWTELPEQGARLATLAPRAFRLADHFDPELPADRIQVVLVTDNTGTLTPGYDRPLEGEVLEGLRRFSASPGHHILVNSGDPFGTLFERTYKPFFDSARPQDLSRYHLVADGGNSRAGLDATGAVAYRSSTEAWPQQQRFEYARKLAELFYEQLRARQGPLAQLFADVSDERLDSIRGEFLARLDRVGSEGAWGVPAQAGETYRFHLLPDDLEARVGQTYVYDVGSKVSLDILNRLNAVPLDFTRELLERFRGTFGQNTEGFYTVSGPGYVDVTKTSKVRGVQATLEEKVYPQLDPSRPVLIVVMGDSSNDLPTFGLRMPGSAQEAMLPVFLSTDASYSGDLPSGVLVGRDQVSGGLEVLQYLNSMSGLKVSEVPAFEGKVWVRPSEGTVPDAVEPPAPAQDSTATPTQEGARLAVDAQEERPYRLLGDANLPVESDWRDLESTFQADPQLRRIFLRAILTRILEREPIPIATQDRAGFFRREGESIVLLDRATRQPLVVDGAPLKFVPSTEDLEAVRRAPALSSALTPQAAVSSADQPTIADLMTDRDRLSDAVQAPLDAHLASLGAPAGLLSVSKSVDTFPFDVERPETFDAYASHFLASLLEVSRTSAFKGVSFRFEGDPARVARLLEMPMAKQLIEQGRILQQVPVDPDTGVQARSLRMTADPASAPDLGYLPEAAIVPGEVAHFKAFILLAVFAGRVDPAAPPETFLGAYRTVLGDEASAGLDARIVARFLRGDVSAEALTLAGRFALKPVRAIEWTQLVQFYRNVQRMIERSA